MFFHERRESFDTFCLLETLVLNLDPFAHISRTELQPEPEFGVDPIQAYELPHTSRLWTPIDSHNTHYEDTLQEREQTSLAKDYLRENLEVVAKKSAQNRLRRSKTMPVTISVVGPPTHNYSSQTLNSTEQAKEVVRDILAEVSNHTISLNSS